MKYKNFENQISEVFRQDSAAVDTDALLSSLGIPVAVEKKDKATWWILSALVLLSLVLVGAYCYINGSNSMGIVDNSTKAIMSSENNFDNNSNEAIAIGDDVVENDEVLNDDVVSSTHTEDLEVAKVVSTKEIELASDVDVNKEKFINSSQEIKTNAVLRKNAKNNKEVTKNNNNTVGQYISQSNNYVSYQNSTEQYRRSDLEVNDSKLIQNNNSNITSTKVRQSVNEIFSLETLESGLMSEKEYPGLADPECPSFSYRIPWNISLLAEVGVMKPMKELEGSNARMDSVLAFRQMNENSKEAIQLGLHAKISKGKNPLYFRAGIAYTRIAEQMSEEYDYIEQDTTRGVISITESMDGDTITRIYGDIISETRYTGRTVKHYFLHLWDLPVAVGYELPIGGSYYVGGEVGAQINFRTSGTGFVFRDVNDYADLSEVTTKETKVGMSYFGGLHFGKHLSKRSSIQLSARFRYYPSTFSTVDPDIKQRYNLAGLHAGYVFRF